MNPDHLAPLHQGFGKRIVAIIFLLIGAAWFRFHGLDWDQGTHLNPDERFLTMVTAGLHLNGGLSEYFNTALSGCNPHNLGHSFFVYGTLPLFLTRIIGEALGMTGYGQIFLVGRGLAACFDLLTLLTTVLIGRCLFGFRVGVAAGALYAVSVLPIQQAHFFTVDSFATSFFFLALFFATRIAIPSTRLVPNLAAFAVFIGCAVASKINMALGALLLPLALWVRFRSVQIQDEASGIRRSFAHLLGVTFVTLFFAFWVFRCANPYFFQGPGFFGIAPNPRVIDNLLALPKLHDESLSFPPAIQWVGRSVTFSGWNLAVWGVGVPLFFMGCAGLGLLWWSIRGALQPALLTVIWTTGSFLLQSLGPNPTLRYQLPVVPGLAIAAGNLWFSTSADGRPRRLCQALGGIVFLLTLGWAVAFSAIYDRPHTRVQASRWILENLASGTVLAFESNWDDAIPLPGTGLEGAEQPFLKQGLFLNIHLPDNRSKAIHLFSTLLRADVLVVTSNRMYGSLCRLPSRFPLSCAFYRYLLGLSPEEDPIQGFADLAAGPVTRPFPLGFAPMAVFSSFPTLGPWRILDQDAEEAFTVYDHPQVTLFRKTAAFDARRVAHLLGIDAPSGLQGSHP